MGCKEISPVVPTMFICWYFSLNLSLEAQRQVQRSSFQYLICSVRFVQFADLFEPVDHVACALMSQYLLVRFIVAVSMPLAHPYS